MERTVQANLQTARILAGALAGGVAVFWVIGWVMTSGGQTGMAPDALPPGLALWVWAGVAVIGFLLALVFRGKALQYVDASSRAVSGESAPANAGAIQSNLIIAWALLEGPALLGGAFFLLLGDRSILIAAVPVYLIGLAATFPRAEWFGAGARP